MEIKLHKDLERNNLRLEVLISRHDVWDNIISSVFTKVINMSADVLFNELKPFLKEDFMRLYNSTKFNEKIQDEVTTRLLNQLLKVPNGSQG